MKTIDPQNTFIKYTVDDGGVLSTFEKSLEEVENGEIYSYLHESEEYSCIAKIVKRELILKDDATSNNQNS